MKKTRLAIVVATNPSIWQSCRIITPNIDACYRSIANSSDGAVEIEYFNYHNNQTELELIDQVKKTSEWKPDIVVFMDHQPHPLRFLEYYKELNPKKCHFIFHVYGDFTLFTVDWISAGLILKKDQCQFIAASHKQVELISSFMENPKSVHYCPFPVDDQRFNFNPSLRQQAREELGIKEDDFVFLYTGRLSPQKNTLEMIYLFEKAFKDHKKPPLFLFAGAFDQLGTPFLGQYLANNQYHSLVNLKLNNLEKTIRDRVHYVGSLEPEELVKYYRASDTFISLSLHNDEDYGMSPIESLLCGTKAILTDWAGYSSFSLKSKYCELIPVSMKNHRLNFDADQFISSLQAALKKGSLKESERQKIHDLYASKFSITSNIKTIEKVVFKGNKVFSGFTPKLKTMSALFKSNQYSPFRHPRIPLAYNTYYEDIYAPYYRKSENRD